jgi:hypothetical protein
MTADNSPPRIEWKPAVTLARLPFGRWQMAASPDWARCRACGAAAVMIDWGTGQGYSIGCDAPLRCTSTSATTPDEAVRKWNANEGIFDKTDPAVIAALQKMREEREEKSASDDVGST